MSPPDRTPNPKDRAPRWARALLRRLAPPGQVEDVLGDLEEAYRARLRHRPLLAAYALTWLEALDVGIALLRGRLRGRRHPSGDRSRISPRGRTFPGLSWLDFKLGGRMLVRYPGLTLVGGISLAFGIFLGTVSWEFGTRILRPTLPFEGGDRVVGIQQLEVAEGARRNPTLDEFREWRGVVGSIEAVSAFRPVERNLALAGPFGEPEPVAEITASGLMLPGTAPLLGRVFTESDEETGAPPVAVIGFDLWQRRFDGDRGVVGTEVRLGGIPTTVVGVMPEGFRFPVAHQLWTPLRVGAPGEPDAAARTVQVFGRLVDGARLERAQAELASIGILPGEEVVPQVVPYVESILSVPRLRPEGAWGLRLFITGLVLIICGNVALLMFARILTREGELLVRNALGAGRGRIVSQLFTEALVLGAVAAVVGLAFAGPGFARLMEILRMDMQLTSLPIWWSDGISSRTILYGVGFTLLGAVVAGVLPALRIAGGHAGRRLRRASAGGGGFHFSGIWSAVIIAQVAVTVAVPPMGFIFYRYADNQRSLDVGFPADDYLTARLEWDAGRVHPDDPAGSDNTFRELQRRLSAHPSVAGVTFARTVPGLYHPARVIEVEPVGSVESEGSSVDPEEPSKEVPPTLHRTGVGMVYVDFFDAMGVSILAGRGFGSADLSEEARAVVVNASFQDHVLGGRSAVGHRLRYAGSTTDEAVPEWYSIVGVVPDMGTVVGDFDPRDDPGIYHPTPVGALQSTKVLIHVPGGADGFSSELRTIAAEVAPGLRVYRPTTVEAAVTNSSGVQIMEFFVRLVTLGSAIGLLLTLAGIYSVVSFAVSRRTREIGVRVALGAEAGRIVRTILWRPTLRVAIGTVLGGIVGGLLARQMLDEVLRPMEWATIAAYAVAMMGVCMAACVMPTRRALSIEPTEALRAEG